MLARIVAERAPENFDLHLFDLPDFDLTENAQVDEVITSLDPDVIINCAAYTNVDGAESEQALATMVNGTAVGYLADAAFKTGATLVHVSTDYVFDGTKCEPYIETDQVNPQSVYGQSKLIGEQSVTGSYLTRYFIVRTSWLYGPYGHNFVETILRLAHERKELKVVADQVGCPTYTADLADAIFNLLGLTENNPYGIYHFSNAGHCSWYEFARAIWEEARAHDLPLEVDEIRAISTADYPLPARRPANSVFDKTKYMVATKATVPGWRESLRTYFDRRKQTSK